jgi:hypothetical protein
MDLRVDFLMTSIGVGSVSMNIVLGLTIPFDYSLKCNPNDYDPIAFTSTLPSYPML